MKKAELIIRILLGAMVLLFGSNKFLGFMPMPPMTAEATTFMGALYNTGYMLKIVGLVQIITGGLLLSNKFTPLALVLLFPVMINAFFFHLFLDISGIGGALFAVAMNVFLFFRHKPAYESILKA